jgi:hypothetical protein
MHAEQIGMKIADGQAYVYVQKRDPTSGTWSGDIGAILAA